MENKNIVIACDHAGFDYKNDLIKYLEAKGYNMTDVGTDSPESCDYPIPVHRLCTEITEGECPRGILICGTGIGISIAANKVKGIRCALLSDVMSARMTREHNDTNMMAIGAAVVGKMLAFEIIDTWLGTEFSHDERHQRRINKLMAVEN